MEPRTIDFTQAGDALAWRRAQLDGVLARLHAGERVVLKVLGWGEIHSRVKAFEGDRLELVSGRKVPIEELLDIRRDPPPLGAF